MPYATAPAPSPASPEIRNYAAPPFCHETRTRLLEAIEDAAAALPHDELAAVCGALASNLPTSKLWGVHAAIAAPPRRRTHCEADRRPPETLRIVGGRPAIRPNA